MVVSIIVQHDYQEEEEEISISPHKNSFLQKVKCDVNFELHLSQNLHLPQKSSVNMEVLTPVKNDESL